MKKFEYRVAESDVVFTEEDLNVYGERGWQLTSFICIPFGSNEDPWDVNKHFVYIFMKEESLLLKREIGEN